MKSSRVITPLTLFTVLALGDLARSDSAASDVRAVGSFRAIEVAGTLEVTSATVDISGTANVELKVADTVAVTTGGTGNVEIHGAPKVTQTITGIGNVDVVE